MIIEILGVIMENLENAILDVGKNAFQKKKLEKDFLESAAFIAALEKPRAISTQSENETLFADKIAAVFSEENMREIYLSLKETPGYEYIEMLKEKLGRLCEAYDVDAEHFVNEFIKMFKKCIYKNDRRLAYEIWGEDLLQEVREMHGNVLEMREAFSAFIASGNFVPATVNEPVLTDNEQETLSEDEKLLKWELHLPERKDGTLKEERVYLTALWKNERMTVPGWYVIPENKREILQMYTRGSELIYNDEEGSFSELFDFTYELVWRYEMSFMRYSERMQRRIQEIWDLAGEKKDFLTETKERKEKFFFIGQTLLRLHRENICDEEWKRIFEITDKCADVVDTGKDQLQIEKIKYSFIQMKITDVRLQLKEVKFSKEAYSVRMQAAGLMAECGMLDDAEKELVLLEAELERKIKEESNKDKLEIVYHRSILASSYFLHRFVLYGLEPMRDDTPLHRLNRKIRLHRNYFDYEKERNTFCKEMQRQQNKARKEVPFEINRDIKVICRADTRARHDYAFYRMLDRIAVPLHINWVRLLDNDESEFISGLTDTTPYVGWYMLLRFESLNTVKNVLTRKKCIKLNEKDGEHVRLIFKYVYGAVERTTDEMHGKDEDFRGNAYGHILKNGMEILRRLASVATIAEQKKLVLLMLKLIETDVVREYNTLNNWISQVMYVLDERVKSSMLNELLQCSTRKRTMIAGEEELDPFDAYAYKTLAASRYSQVDLEPQLVNCMLDRCEKSEQDKMHYIPRLGMLAQWKLLTAEQSRRFGEILWKDVDEEHFPLDESYHLKVYLEWPHPDNINTEAKIKEVILSKKAFEKIKEKALSSFIPRENRLFREIRDINTATENFWTEKELEFIVDECKDYWTTLKEKFEEERCRDGFEDEFADETRTMIKVLASFGRKSIKNISAESRVKIAQMEAEISSYNIECMELRVLICTDEELKNITDQILEGCRSVDKEIVTSAAEAILVLLLADIEKTWMNKICDSLLELCFYRKEPGLHDFLYLLEIGMYLGKMELSESQRRRMSTILADIDSQTDYTQITEESETQIKEIIMTRMLCAHLAYQLYLYEEKQNMEHADGTLLWKDICRGERSCKEFAEVRTRWI